MKKEKGGGIIKYLLTLNPALAPDCRSDSMFSWVQVGHAHQKA